MFSNFARAMAAASGGSWAFVLATLMIILWLILGPVFHFSDTWQLVINTVTTIVTFLMVFLIQNTQNRDTTAIHLKLDEILRATKNAHNELVDIEKLSDKELETLQERYSSLAQKVKSELKRGQKDTGTPDV